MNETLGQEGMLDDVLRRARLAQTLRDNDAPVIRCNHCQRETVPRDLPNIRFCCVWCDGPL